MNGGKCHDAKAQPLQTPSLTEIVFIGLRPANELNPAHYPEEGQPCVREYLAAVAPGSNLWAFKVSFSPEKVVLLRKRHLIEQMITILGREVRAEAEAFADAMPLLAEWEGMSEGPVQKVEFVDQWFKQRRGTSIAPFLYLLKAHRLRAAYEAARANHVKDNLPILARRYRQALNEARSSTNSLILCIVDDLEAQPFVYLEGQGRP